MKHSLLISTGLLALSLAYPALAQDMPKHGQGGAMQEGGAMRPATGEKNAAEAQPRAPKAAESDNNPAQRPAAQSDNGADQSAGQRKARAASQDNDAAGAKPMKRQDADAEQGQRHGVDNPKNSQAERTRADEQDNRTQAGDKQGEARRVNADADRQDQSGGGASRHAADADHTKDKARQADQKGGDDQTQRQADMRPGRDANDKNTEARADVRVQGRFKLDDGRARSVRETLVERHDAEIRDRSFRIALGVAIPAAVHAVVLPDEIVADYPEFRGYDYVTVDDRVAIVAPHSREIVEVIGDRGDRYASDDEVGDASARASGEVRFTRDQDDMIRRTVQVSSYSGARPVLRVPGSVDLRPLPKELVASMPNDAAYGYFVDRENRIVIADPHTREVVDIVD